MRSLAEGPLPLMHELVGGMALDLKTLREHPSSRFLTVATSCCMTVGTTCCTLSRQHLLQAASGHLAGVHLVSTCLSCTYLSLE